MPLRVAAQRLGYRVAFRLLQVRWMLAHPRVEGVKCVITDGDRVLLVRHTYGAGAWDLPGGRRRRRETPLASARREMEEELGLEGVAWRALGELRGSEHGRRDLIYIFGAELTDPSLRIDPVELRSAAWFHRDRLPLWVGVLLLPILAGVSREAFAPHPARTRSCSAVYS